MSWRPVDDPGHEPHESEHGPASLRGAILSIVATGTLILGAGYVLTQAADAMAAQLRVSENFMGATLVAVSTSLPEISTVVAAVKLRRYMMAFSDIFGTNIFDVMLIFVVDLAYAGPPVINEQGRFAGFGAVLAMVVTLLYLAGLIERRDRTFLRLGLDSWAVLGAYLAALPILYAMS